MNQWDYKSYLQTLATNKKEKIRKTRKCLSDGVCVFKGSQKVSRR